MTAFAAQRKIDWYRNLAIISQTDPRETTLKEIILLYTWATAKKGWYFQTKSLKQV